MKVLGNIIWFVCSGFWAWLAWSIVGILLCLTIIGIPFALQCFKIGAFGLFPFGKTIVFSDRGSHLILNLIWILLLGWELAIVHMFSALLLCITIIGIPFALQSVKMAGISLLPFGIEIYKEG